MSLEEHLVEWMKEELELSVPVQEEKIIFPLEVHIYVKDEDVTARASYVHGYLRGNQLNVSFSFPKNGLRDKEGRLYIVPFGVGDLFRYGGFGPHLVGPADLESEADDEYKHGSCNWLRAPNGLDAIGLNYLESGGPKHGTLYVSMSALYPKGRAWPWRLFGGLECKLNIQIP